MRNKNDTRTFYIDGAKSIELSQYPDEAWTWLTGEPDAGVSGVKDYYKAIPWLFRGTMLRADAVSKMPFTIFKGETEFETSKDYENKLGILPNPKHTFKLIEMSLTLMGMSYLFNVRNQARTLELKYLNPTTIEPKITEDEGLVGFIRTLTSQKFYPIEDIIYFWYEDPYVEIGPPLGSPAKAALMASGVLANVDEFVASFFKRGAIKATLFSAKGIGKTDSKKFETWFEKWFSGAQNAFRTKVMNAEDVKPVVIGEGIEGLQDTALTREKREDIGTALGIPHTLLFSDAANYATAEQDDFHFYDKTIVPECWFIASVLNDQVLGPMGYRLEFQPDTLDVFQTDENERAQALNYLTTASMPLEVALRTLGFELSDEDWALIEQEREDREARAEEMTQGFAQGASNESDDETEDNTRNHLDKWRRKAVKRVKGGKTAVCEFESEFITPALSAAIMGSLESASTLDDVNNVFAWIGYP